MERSHLGLAFVALWLPTWLGGGLYWFAASLILSLVVALFSAWVLLIEILR
ncbi:MAG TPA: hypothetical protein VHV81_09135 [Steroidobacteraceae bacterium]|nr:hypothetical protein [Steroidobacteraceae bacterium]